ncbi:MAG: DUF4097 family beta strand repeat-containing protein [Candidatus Zhuqueibacterota bacterium]
MKTYLKRWFISLVVVSLCVASLSAAEKSDPLSSSQREKIVKSFDVANGQLLFLKSDLGSVKVNTWDRREVRIEVVFDDENASRRDVERIFDNFEVTFDQDSRGVQVFGEYTGSPRWLSGFNRVRIRFDILVPREFDLDITTSGGSIEVADLTGAIDLNTSGGSIRIGDVKGPVKANTSGGSISVAGADGDVDVRTSGGSISVGETKGSIYAQTSGGGITLDRVTGNAEAYTSGGSLNFENVSGSVNGKTSGGSIYARITGKIDSECSLKTSGGGIKLILPADIAVNIDARTSGGRVSTDFPVTVKGVIKKNELNGQVNGGGPLVFLRTSGGSISINSL